MPNTCTMDGCPSNGHHNKFRSFFGFPRNPDRCKAWAVACGMPQLMQQHGVDNLHKRYHVCDLHFKKSDRNKKKLKADAVPFSHNQTPMETQSTQTDPVVSDTSDSDSDVGNDPDTAQSSTATCARQKRTGEARKKQQLKKLQVKLRRLKEGESGLSPDLFRLIHLQTELFKCKQDKKYEKKIQLFALNLYLACPRTYKSLVSSINLPSEKVLRRTNLDIGTVMSCSVLISLNVRITSLKAMDRYCTVSLRKMPLKRFLFYHINKDKVIGFRNINGDETMDPATEVYVVIARGLQTKWEQPLAYCFLGKNESNMLISPWLDDVLVTIIGIGYNVVALVVDHEDLYDYCRNRIQSFTQPYIFINRHASKVYCIFDLPQLIISLRNILLTHKLQFQDDDGSLVIADWDIIESLHSRNSGGLCALVTKLTKSHIHPNESEKKELKYAAEVFSKSVSEALELESKIHGEYDSRIRGTRKLTALVNDVFDILNSSALNHHNKCKNAFTGEPYQMRTIRKFMEFLTNVKPLNDSGFEDNSFNCLYGLRISIMSFSIILRDLLPKGITSLVTHRFNLAAADRLFDFVKQKSKSEKPTAVQFYKYFRQKFMSDLMKCPRSTNRIDNLHTFLGRVDLKQISRNKMKFDDFSKTIEVNTVDYRFELPTSDSFQYVCWYLMKRCYQVHDNSKCELLNLLLNDRVLGVNWKTYAWDSYFRPPEVFIQFVKTLDKKFNSSFGNKMEIGLGTGILMVLKELTFHLICPCFPVNYLRRLFVRLRIFNIIRYNNRQMWDESFRFSNTDHYNIDIM